MVQLQILNGRKAGVNWTARLLPVQVGRSSDSHLCLEDEGVWDRHFILESSDEGGIVLRQLTEGRVTVNHESVQSVRLHNGDSIEAGSVHLRFWISSPLQRSQNLRELLVWAAIAIVGFGQLLLMFRYLP